MAECCKKNPRCKSKENATIGILFFSIVVLGGLVYGNISTRWLVGESLEFGLQTACNYTECGPSEEFDDGIIGFVRAARYLMYAASALSGLTILATLIKILNECEPNKDPKKKWPTLEYKRVVSKFIFLCIPVLLAVLLLVAVGIRNTLTEEVDLSVAFFITIAALIISFGLNFTTCQSIKEEERLQAEREAKKAKEKAVEVLAFVNPPKDQKVSVGQKAELKCKVARADKVIWTYGNANTTTSVVGSSETFDKTHGNATLSIINVQIKHSGVYTCKAVGSDNKEVTTFCTLTVEPVKPIFSNFSKNMDVEVGQTVNIEGKISNAERVQWYHGAKLLDQQNMTVSQKQRLKMTFISGKASLIITNVISEDGGVYKCSALSGGFPSLETTKPCKVNVYTACHPYFEDVQPYHQAVFLHSSEIKLKVGGYPTPQITWYKECTEVKHDPNIRIEFSEKIARLKFQATKMEDCGIYMCSAVNKHGHSAISLQLSVMLT